jgi:Predicted oxidoreductase related to nitroreductase
VGKVLFFVDFESLAPIKSKFPMYADKFDPFAIESNGMSQYLGKSYAGLYHLASLTAISQCGSPLRLKDSERIYNITAR